MGRVSKEIVEAMRGSRQAIKKGETAKEIVARGPRNAAREIVNQKKGWPAGTSAWSVPISDKPVRAKKGFTVKFWKPSGTIFESGSFRTREAAEEYGKKMLVGSDSVADFRVVEEE